MLGLVVRADDTGLGNQTRELCYMLKPDKVLIIDSTPFNKNQQHFDWYDSFKTDKVLGFPDIRQYRDWLKGLTHVVTAETFYNDNITRHALRMGIKTYIQPNFEFSDYMVRPITPPTMFLYPSYWRINEFTAKYPNTIYLPPPLTMSNFTEARKENMRKKHNRLLHVVGKEASKDRNGTQSVLEALKHLPGNFELIVRSQHPLDVQTDDKRVMFAIGNLTEQQDLYTGFDAMILPRRYGGLCLPMNEALLSGLPVIMTDVEPNNMVLPKEWLVPAKVQDVITARMELPVYAANPEALAKTISSVLDSDLADAKAQALEIGLTYSADSLRGKYKGVLYGDDSSVSQ